MRVKIAKWGNSLAVRIPRGVVDEARLKEGQEFEIEAAGEGRVALLPIGKRYTLEELLASMPPGTDPTETIDWGPDRGSEILPDDDYARGLITDKDIIGARDDRRRR